MAIPLTAPLPCTGLTGSPRLSPCSQIFLQQSKTSPHPCSQDSGPPKGTCFATPPFSPCTPAPHSCHPAGALLAQGIRDGGAGIPKRVHCLDFSGNSWSAAGELGLHSTNPSVQTGFSSPWETSGSCLKRQQPSSAFFFHAASLGSETDFHLLISLHPPHTHFLSASPPPHFRSLL